MERRRIREAKDLERLRERQDRIRWVGNDMRLDLPVSPQMPDGEEYPRTSPMHLRTYDQRSEIVKGHVQVPPNRTICNSGLGWDSGGLESSTSSSSSGGGVGSNCKKCQYSQGDPKSNSTGWLGSWKSSSKTPAATSRTKCHHLQRHSHPPNNSKNSSSKHKGSSGSSSTSSSTSSLNLKSSSSTGLLGGGSSQTKTSLSEKLQTFFSDRTHAPQISDQPKGSPDTSSTGLFSRFKEESKRSRGNSKSSKSSGDPDEPELLRSSPQPPLFVMVSKQARNVTKTNSIGARSRTSCGQIPELSSHAPFASSFPEPPGPPTKSHQSGTGSGTGTSEQEALYSNPSPSSLESHSPLCESRGSPGRDCPPTGSTSDSNGNARVDPTSSPPPLSPGADPSYRTEDCLVERDIVYEQDSSISQRMRRENGESQMSLEEGEELPASSPASPHKLTHSQQELDQQIFSRHQDSNPP